MWASSDGEPPAPDDRAALLEVALSARLVNKIAQAIATQRSVHDLIRTAVEHTRALCDADGASLLLLDPETNELTFDLVDGTAAGRIEHVRIPAGRGIAGKVARDRVPMLVPDVRTCPDFENSVDVETGYTTGSIIAVPLLHRGEVIGVLEAVRTAAEAPFDERYLKRLVDLAPHVLIAVRQVQIDEKLSAANDALVAINAGLEEQVNQRTEMLSRAKREWERTFDAISDPIALQDNFEIRRANLAFARAAGVRITEITGKKCYQLFAGRDAPCPNCPLVNGRVEGDLAAEIEARGAVFRFSAFWLSDDPTDARAVVQYRDVTVQKQLEKKAREGERLIAVGRLADGAAHEINNPIGFVSANLQALNGLLEDLVEGTAAPEDVTDGLAMVSESLDGVRRVKEIVAGLREFSHLGVSTTEQMADVNASISRVASVAGGRKPQLDLSATGLVNMGPLQLDQALGHVVRNAVQASKPDQPIRIRSWNEGSQIRIEVKDEGTGMTPDTMRRMFEPFFTTRGIGKGVGLGLTSAYGLIKRVGGDIHAVSAPGQGSTFTVVLNLL